MVVTRRYAVTDDQLAARFEAERGHLRAVAYRMLGSLTEADDAVQEAWLRLSRTADERIENLGGWLTTVVARICLDMLRTRRSRSEEPLEVYVPDPVIGPPDGHDPEHEALLADSVGLALLVVLETLSPAERLAFVLHDLFGVPFDQIAPMVDRTPDAAKMLASRARRRVRGAGPGPTADRDRQREVVNAFLAASRRGDFDGLLAVLDPDVILRADTGLLPFAARGPVVGAATVAGQAMTFARLAPLSRPALVNGTPGFVAVRNGTVQTVIGFTVVADRIVEIDILADPGRLRHVDAGQFG
jgi:RNA polymerase sigma-70 factor (ECF subfamily)